jgi:hypothetical protein
MSLKGFTSTADVQQIRNLERIVVLYPDVAWFEFTGSPWSEEKGPGKGTQGAVMA